MPNLLVLLTLFTYNIFAHGETSGTRLFHQGRPVYNYDEQLDKLKPGTVLAFDDGQKFKIIEKIGEGSTTFVVKVVIFPNGTKPFALRIPLSSGFWPHTPKGTAPKRIAHYINDTVQAYEELKDSRIRIPRLYRSLPSQYALMEYVPVDFTMNVFLQTPHQIPEGVRVRALNALRKFAADVAEWKILWDFRQGNIAYSDLTAEWFFLDQLPGNQKFSPSERDVFETPFSGQRLLYSPARKSTDWAASVFRMLEEVVHSARCELVL